MNAILAIHPYKSQGLWMFDDPGAGLHREPFVAGADQIIERLTEPIPDAAAGFTLLFSANPFPGATAELERGEEDLGGYWYSCAALGMKGWLCPALFRYFAEAPPRLHAQFRPRGD